MMHPVDVIIVTDKEGHLRPLYVIWDHLRYKIRSIRNVRPNGDKGIMYECLIEDRLRYLFHRDECWFIE